MQEEFKEYYRKLGFKVAYYRKVRGWTQEQLADRMMVDTSFIGQIEAKGIDKAISMDTLFRLAQTLEIPAYKLLYFDD